MSLVEQRKEKKKVRYGSIMSQTIAQNQFRLDIFCLILEGVRVDSPLYVK